jgi:hypothetical protein
VAKEKIKIPKGVRKKKKKRKERLCVNFGQ